MFVAGAVLFGKALFRMILLMLGCWFIVSGNYLPMIRAERLVRHAIGINELPLNLTVEVEFLFKLKDCLFFCSLLLNREPGNLFAARNLSAQIATHRRRKQTTYSVSLS